MKLKLENKKLSFTLLFISVFVVITASAFLVINESESRLIAYTKNKNDVRVYLFDKLTKKSENNIVLLDNDPKIFALNREVDDNTDVVFTYNKELKRVEIYTADDDLVVNSINKYNLRVNIKEIAANVGDVLTFKDNTLNVTEDLKSVFKLKDILDGITLETVSDPDNSDNLLKDQNYSFEEGLWTKDVNVCEKVNDKSSIFKQYLSNDCTDGKKCLFLSSKNNVGCVSNLFNVVLNSGNTYSLSFDYKNSSKDSEVFLYLALFSNDGQITYYNQKIPYSNDFKRYSFKLRADKNIVSIMTRLSVKGENGEESDLMFDNLAIKEVGGSRFFNIDKNIKKEYLFGKMTLNDINKFKVNPNFDSEVSDNSFDYYLTFENKYEGSSFIKKIEIAETINRALIFIVFALSLVTVYLVVLLFGKIIKKFIHSVCAKIKLLFNSFLSYIYGIFKDFINKIKTEKKIFIAIKFLVFVAIFGFFIYQTIVDKKSFDVLSAFALFYGLISILFVIDSRISAFGALIYLILCPILLILKKDNIAEDMAVQAYYFLVITVITQIREMRKGN